MKPFFQRPKIACDKPHRLSKQFWEKIPNIIRLSKQVWEKIPNIISDAIFIDDYFPINHHLIKSGDVM